MGFTPWSIKAWLYTHAPRTLLFHDLCMVGDLSNQVIELERFLLADLKFYLVDFITMGLHFADALADIEEEGNGSSLLNPKSLWSAQNGSKDQTITNNANIFVEPNHQT